MLGNNAKDAPFEELKLSTFDFYVRWSLSHFWFIPVSIEGFSNKSMTGCRKILGDGFGRQGFS